MQVLCKMKDFAREGALGFTSCYYFLVIVDGVLSEREGTGTFEEDIVDQDEHGWAIQL